ncbi:MAG: hypothetical protein V3R74_11115, partial [Alphaproteobacteria bacterium]
QHGVAARQTAELIENVGIIADRLLAACTLGPGVDTVDPRLLPEQALIVAAGDTVENLLAQADANMYRNKRAKPRIRHAWRRRKA